MLLLLDLTFVLLQDNHSFIHSYHYTYFPAELFSLNYRHDLMRIFLFSKRLICKPLKYTRQIGREACSIKK